MLLAQPYPRRQSAFSHQHFPHSISIPIQHQQPQPQPQPQPQFIATSADTTIQPLYTPVTDNNIFSFENADQPLFDFEPEQFNNLSLSQSFPLMQPDHSNNSWFSNGQLTPQSATRSHHHRESSLSSLGSAGPASPYTPNTSHPLIAGDFYDGFSDFQNSAKPLTPAQTPITQESFLTNYQNFYNNLAAYTMSHDGLPKQQSDSASMPAPEFSNADRPAMAAVAGNDSRNTPPTSSERRKAGELTCADLGLKGCLQAFDVAYMNTVPKLDRTMTDVYGDELYNPSFQITSVPPATVSPTSSTLSSQNDVFSQRLQAANSQHLSANTQTPLSVPDLGRSPFRQGSPLAPTTDTFDSQARFGTATQLREKQKAENDARVLRDQIARTSPDDEETQTISPKDVDLVYCENEEDAAMPLFPVKQEQSSPTYRPTNVKHERSASDASEQSYRSMATTRQDSASSYPSSSQTSQQRSSFSFVPPAVPGGVRQMPQQYPFVPQQRRQPSSMSNVSEDFPATLTSMESSNSEYAPDARDIQKPRSAQADTGTYTCTYHGCTLRFESPAKLQKHKREGHRNSASLATLEQDGMTSSGQKLATQAGPHSKFLSSFLLRVIC